MNRLLFQQRQDAVSTHIFPAQLETVYVQNMYFRMRKTFIRSKTHSLFLKVKKHGLFLSFTTTECIETVLVPEIFFKLKQSK